MHLATSSTASTKRHAALTKNRIHAVRCDAFSSDHDVIDLLRRQPDFIAAIGVLRKPDEDIIERREYRIKAGDE